MTYDEACTYLFTLPSFSSQGAQALHPGLAHMQILMEAMDNPHRAFSCVHVAGTNGKGSTTSMLAAVASAFGRRTGLHTSPHLFDFTERMRIDGRPAPRDWVAAATARFKGIFDAVQPSFFEASTALSFLYFAEQEIDLAVIEVGMGGRLDATNIVDPLLVLITSIGFDHTGELGETLPKIAGEKAGIIKAGIPVMTNAVQPEVLAVLRQTAVRHRASFHAVLDECVVTHRKTAWTGLELSIRTPVQTYERLRIDLPGRHQEANALLSIRAAEHLFGSGARSAIFEGIGHVRILAGLRARCEILNQEPLIVVDVAHNSEGLEAALQVMQSAPTANRGALYVLFGVMRDKPVDAMVRLLSEVHATVLPVDVRTERAMPRTELRALLEEQRVSIVDVPDVVSGVQWFLLHGRPVDQLLVVGSHRIIAELGDFDVCDYTIKSLKTYTNTESSD